MKLTSLVALTILASGCAASAEEDASLASASELASGPACNAPFFANHPHTGSVTLSTGQSAPTPYWACGFGITIYYGVVDYAPIARLAEGTGFTPYSTMLDGQKKAFARLFVNTYRHSDGGAYRETVLTYDVASGPERAIPWVNAYSALVPALDPSNIAMGHRLYLDRQLPITYGRDVFGYDKRWSHLSIESNDTHERFSFTDETGHIVARGRTTFDGSPAAQQAFAVGLMQALGVSSLPPPPPETTYAIATRDVKSDGDIKQIAATFQWSHGFPTTNAFAGSLSFDCTSEIGSLLQNAHFDVKTVAHDSNANMVMALH